MGKTSLKQARGARNGGQKALPYYGIEIQGRTVSYSPQQKKHQSDLHLNVSWAHQTKSLSLSPTPVHSTILLPFVVVASPFFELPRPKTLKACLTHSFFLFLSCPSKSCQFYLKIFPEGDHFSLPVPVSPSWASLPFVPI